ncbi:hypothetical protein [Flavobacterium sp.]|uniref:hypothetical protein n=1 Tax=Flavobacterium sp. TaxID=239 RepID=UPI002628DE07|nr:hypothetical protein [Flavobacterium sp.]
MKKSLILLLIIITAFITISCSKDDDKPNNYQGNWSGSISGDLDGTWTGRITSTGNFSGKVITTQSSPDHDLNLAGQVNENGVLVGTMNNTTFNITIKMTGNFQTTTGNGTWIFNGAGMQGTWIASKE